MREPWRSQFVQLVKSGAGARDIHDSDGAGSYDSGEWARASERFVAREIARVPMHAASLCEPLARRLARAPRILDVGCGTGGTSVALALSDLGAEEVVGVDASVEAVRAATVRGKGYGLDGPRLRFLHVTAGTLLPFEAGSFDLVTCVSVLEFVTAPGGREGLVAEMLRVLKPGGHLFLATPNPIAPRELHTGRWFGNQRRSRGYPWASSARTLRRMLHGCRVESMAADRLRRHRVLRRFAWAAPLLAWAMPWQRLLARKGR